MHAEDSLAGAACWYFNQALVSAALPATALTTAALSTLACAATTTATAGTKEVSSTIDHSGRFIFFSPDRELLLD